MIYLMMATAVKCALPACTAFCLRKLSIVHAVVSRQCVSSHSALLLDAARQDKLVPWQPHITKMHATTLDHEAIDGHYVVGHPKLVCTSFWDACSAICCHNIADRRLRTDCT